MEKFLWEEEGGEKVDNTYRCGEGKIYRCGERKTFHEGCTCLHPTGTGTFGKRTRNARRSACAIATAGTARCTLPARRETTFGKRRTKNPTGPIGRRTKKPTHPTGNIGVGSWRRIGVKVGVQKVWTAVAENRGMSHVQDWGRLRE